MNINLNRTMVNIYNMYLSLYKVVTIHSENYTYAWLRIIINDGLQTRYTNVIQGF